MKKVILLAAYLFISACTVFSQSNTFPASGNVGIGTMAPVSKLQVIGGKIFIGSPATIDSYDQLYSAGANPGFRQEVQRTSGGATFDLFKVYGHKTSATGDALWARVGIYGGFGTSGVDAAPTVNYMFFGTEPTVSYTSNTFRLYPNKTAYFDGNVGIGTTAPGANLDINGTTYSRKIFIGTPDGNTATKIAPYSLAVNGTAIFTKAVVKLNTLWPDYVFYPNYKLPQLDSLQQFLKSNGHLPEMPNADEVARSGLDLGENQTLLLKKIEELTLIVIEQNKRIEKLENDNHLKSKEKK